MPFIHRSKRSALKLFSRYKRHKAQHIDDSFYVGETEIFRNRFILGTLVLAIGYFFINNPLIITSFSIYLLSAILLYYTQIKDIINQNIRISIGLLIENSMAFYLLSLDPSGFAFTYPIYLWIILGNGFRFGVKWLQISSLCSVISFSAIIYMQPFWQQNLGLSISLLIALIVIPAYCASLIKKLSLAKEKAETANRAKSYFLASVSHELRTPLNAIIGYGTHLSDMNLTPSQLKMVNSCVSAGQYQLQLIEQLLQLGKSDTQSEDIDLINFKITDLLIEARDILQVRAKEKGLELLLQSEPDCHQIYYGPMQAIKNLLLNITSNAVKFTDNGKIIIRSSIKHSTDNLSLEISIIDTGIGINEEACNKIFEPFQQADETIMERFGGTGLGLAICSQIIKKIDGNISVSSEVGQGSTFNLSIPISNSSNDIHEDQINHHTKIISLGNAKEDMLLQAQCSGEYFISHFDCDSIGTIQNEIDKIDLEDFDIAILDQKIVGNIESTDIFWKQFQKSSTACIIVSDDDEFDIHKIGIQAAFASILSPSTSFDNFRHAVQIGTSFVDKNHDHTDFNDVDEDETKIDTAINLNANNNTNILVVDDNRTNRMVLESILLSDGYNVILAEDGDIALEKLEENDFSLVLIDVNMPRLNGIEATKLWRQIENPEKAIPIMGVTADATEETLHKCLAAGMNERMTKPIEAKKLLEKVKFYCSEQKNTSQSNVETINIEENIKEVTVIETTDTEVSNKKMIDINIIESIDKDRIEYLQSIGDNDFIRLVIESYVDETNEMLSKLTNGSKYCEVDKFKFTAHAIKSSANNVGATKLSKLCSKYETIEDYEYNSNPKEYIDILTYEVKDFEKKILLLKEHYSNNEENSETKQTASI